MWLEGIKRGICFPISTINTHVIQQAVINLGGGKYVERESVSWWIKDFWELPVWKRRLIRLKILIKVGGYRRLRKEALRVENKLFNMPVSCPDLMPDRYICPQIKNTCGVPVASKQLRDILLSIGCPNVSEDCTRSFWAIVDSPSTPEGIRAREEIIQFIEDHWDTVRIRLCI